MIIVHQICIYIQIHIHFKKFVSLHVQLMLNVLDILFDLQDGGSTSLWNVDELVLNCMILQYKRSYTCYYIFKWCINFSFFLMFPRYFRRKYLPSFSQSGIEMKGGTGVDDLRVLSPHKQLQSEPYPSLLCTRDNNEERFMWQRWDLLKLLYTVVFLHVCLQMGSWLGSIQNLWVQLQTVFLLRTSHNKLFFTVRSC
jgi:hypothetical protein